eukprot:scaffold38_cov67-Phaeocystis_antarctica.AAC.1
MIVNGSVEPHRARTSFTMRESDSDKTQKGCKAEHKMMACVLCASGMMCSAMKRSSAAMPSRSPSGSPGTGRTRIQLRIIDGIEHLTDCRRVLGDQAGLLRGEKQQLAMDTDLGVVNILDHSIHGLSLDRGEVIIRRGCTFSPFCVRQLRFSDCRAIFCLGESLQQQLPLKSIASEQPRQLRKRALQAELGLTPRPDLPAVLDLSPRLHLAPFSPAPCANASSKVPGSSPALACSERTTTHGSPGIPALAPPPQTQAHSQEQPLLPRPAAIQIAPRAASAAPSTRPAGRPPRCARLPRYCQPPAVQPAAQLSHLAPPAIAAAPPCAAASPRQALESETPSPPSLDLAARSCSQVPAVNKVQHRLAVCSAALSPHDRVWRGAQPLSLIDARGILRGPLLLS